MKQSAARTVGFKPGERNVFFHILTACNLSCRHCYINPVQHGTNSVSKEVMVEWLQLFISPNKETNIIFLGGEPTLHPHLADGVRTAKNLGYASVTVDSNGFLFNNFLESVTAAELDYLSFSLDGPNPAVNDLIRGEGVFAVCTENIRRAVNKGFNVSVIYTVSRFNIDALFEMPALLVELGVKRFFIQVIGIRGKTAQQRQDNWQLRPAEWLDKVPPVAKAAADFGIHVIYPKVFLNGDEVFECAGVVAENFFIFPNGRVYLCPLVEDYPLHTYNIENGKLMRNEGLVEENLFTLNIPEGCVMNKLLQPDNLQYTDAGLPCYRISCCLLKQEMKRA